MLDPPFQDPREPYNYTAKEVSIRHVLKSYCRGRRSTFLKQPIVTEKYASSAKLICAATALFSAQAIKGKICTWFDTKSHNLYIRLGYVKRLKVAQIA